MPDLKDFHAFKSTSRGYGSSYGCFGSSLIWILAILVLLSTTISMLKQI